MGVEGRLEPVPVRGLHSSGVARAVVLDVPEKGLTLGAGGCLGGEEKRRVLGIANGAKPIRGERGQNLIVWHNGGSLHEDVVHAVQLNTLRFHHPQRVEQIRIVGAVAAKASESKQHYRMDVEDLKCYN